MCSDSVRQKGVVVSKTKLEAANGTPIKTFGERMVQFGVRGLKGKAGMKFMVADVQKPLAAVSAIVAAGNEVVFRAGEKYDALFVAWKLEHNAAHVSLPELPPYRVRRLRTPPRSDGLDRQDRWAAPTLPRAAFLAPGVSPPDGTS